ncbi:MAG: universal stress protein [Nitrososphaera sp.]|jgi:nucleotide-binding universal stress UspA family protein
MAIAKILVCIDGSEASMKAADYAIEMAKKHDAQLTALSVVASPLGHAYSPGPFGFGASPSTMTEVAESARREARKWLDETENRAAAQGVNFMSEIIESASSVVPAIVHFAEENKIDLIVTGTRGRSGFKKMILGSVASGLTTHASCSVMIVK